MGVEDIPLIISTFAVVVAIITIIASVCIAKKNREHQFAKEKYFKLQQIAENIIGKLLVLENHREKFRMFFENHRDASFKGNKVKDPNDIFNKRDFENNCEVTAAYIEIYFEDIGIDYSKCLSAMGELYVFMANLDLDIKREKEIIWDEKAELFNGFSEKIGNKPKEISDKIKDVLKKYKKDNL